MRGSEGSRWDGLPGHRRQVPGLEEVACSRLTTPLAHSRLGADLWVSQRLAVNCSRCGHAQGPCDQQGMSSENQRLACWQPAVWLQAQPRAPQLPWLSRGVSGRCSA